MKKKIAFILSICTVLCSTGCGDRQTGSNADGKTTLKWILSGPGLQKDSAEVWAKVNEKLKTYDGLSDTELSIEVFDNADYQQKFLLLQTSGQQLDIVQTYGLDYHKEVKNKSFIALDDYIAGTDAFKDAFPDWFWDYAIIDGKRYYVPNYQILTNADYSFYTQKELSDKYWDIKKASETFCAEATFTDKCWDVVEEYLDTLSKNGQLKMGYMPLDSLTFTLNKGYESVVTRFLIKMDDPEHKVLYMDELPERINSFKRVSNLYKKGYIRKDISSIADSDTAMGSKDGYTLWHGGTNIDPERYENQLKTTSERYGFEVDAARLSNYDYIPSVNAAGGTAIAVSSKNPDKAFKVITLMNTKSGKDLYNMMVYGIEGEHYDVISDNVIKPKDYQVQGDSASRYGLYKWNVGNAKYAFVPESDSVTTPEKIDECNTADNVKRSSLMGFVADTSSLTTELAQINSVFEEYKDLNRGTYSDVDKTYNEYMDKVKKAGMEKVKEELQKQVDEFFKNKK